MLRVSEKAVRTHLTRLLSLKKCALSSKKRVTSGTAITAIGTATILNMVPSVIGRAKKREVTKSVWMMSPRSLRLAYQRATSSGVVLFTLLWRVVMRYEPKRIGKREKLSGGLSI